MDENVSHNPRSHGLTLYWVGTRLNKDLIVFLNGREREAKTITKFPKFSKINPEGTCGPIWPEVVPLVLSSLWLYYCVKKIVNM